MQLSNSAQFLGMDSSYDDADVVVFGAPFDGTTSFRPGTRFAMSCMRSESDGIETYSPKLDLDLEQFNVSDVGDIEVSTGDTVKVLSEIRDVAKRLVADGKKPLMVGGEHLVTLPVIEAMAAMNPDLHIIHLDAHTDLREEFNGSKLSHATVIKRCWDILGDGRIFQFGIRSGTKDEFDFALVDKHTYMERFTVDTAGDVLRQLAGKKVYVTIDLDVLDPSIFAGTGTPEAGGITYRELENFFLALQAADINFVGADIVELSPHYDSSGVSTAVACKVLREMALLLALKS